MGKNSDGNSGTLTETQRLALVATLDVVPGSVVQDAFDAMGGWRKAGAARPPVEVEVHDACTCRPVALTDCRTGEPRALHQIMCASLTAPAPGAT